MKPKPLSSLNHFTVPVGMRVPPVFMCWLRGGCCPATTDEFLHCFVEMDFDLNCEDSGLGGGACLFARRARSRGLRAARPRARDRLRRGAAGALTFARMNAPESPIATGPELRPCVRCG